MLQADLDIQRRLLETQTVRSIFARRIKGVALGIAFASGAIKGTIALPTYVEENCHA